MSKPRPSRRSLAIAVSLLFLAGASIVWNVQFRTHRHVRLEPNVLLIGIDTLRADAIGAYGARAARTRTPTLDALARRGAIFDRAFAQAPVTGPSFSSILTGRYPVEHTVANSTKRLPDEEYTMAEYLRDRGYATGAFVSCGILAKRYGFAQGFEKYDERLLSRYDGNRHERDGAHTTMAALNWLDEQSGERPFFAWVHYFDAHAPYVPHGPTQGDASVGGLKVLRSLAHKPKERAEALPTIRSLYAGEVTYIDAQIAKLLRSIRRKGMEDDTLVIVAADHGEELFDHDNFHGHYTQLTQSVLHVPLIFSGAGVAPGRRVSEWVENVDILPTLQALVEGSGAPKAGSGTTKGRRPRVSGRDLSPAFAGKKLATHAARAQREPYRGMRGGMGFAAVRERWKLQWFGRDGGRLYDLNMDPMERRDVGASHPEILAELTELVLPWHNRNEELGYKARYQLSPDDEAVLKALGYVQ